MEEHFGNCCHPWRFSPIHAWQDPPWNATSLIVRVLRDRTPMAQVSVIISASGHNMGGMLTVQGKDASRHGTKTTSTSEAP